VLTGYPTFPLQVFRINPATGVVSSTVTNIFGPAPTADGFTVLPNGNFLINNGDAECTYNQYDPTTGTVISGTTIVVTPTTAPHPGFGVPSCTGVDTDGTSLFFLTNFNSITKTTLAGAPISTVFIGNQFVEDISIVR